MKRRYKAYLRINLVSVIFIIVSFISVTLAWFAYSGLATVSTEIGVKAWNIELKKNNEIVSHDIVISLANIYPGMNTVNETVNIKNLGDSDAQVRYSIISARLLDNEQDNYVIDDTITSPYVEDLLSHEYPFHININLSKNYVLAKGDESSFEVSVSWPLDSGNNNLDSTWGNQAYDFQKSELEKKEDNQNYQIQPSLKIIISVMAEQYIESAESSDLKYNLGDEILYDVIENKKCTEISSHCLQTHIIDVNNQLKDTTVTLLPNINTNYLSSTYANHEFTLSSMTSNWTVNTRPLIIGDILKIISKDITSSTLVRNNVSDSIIGNITYQNRMTQKINQTIQYNGYYRFINAKFNYLSSTNCYWTNSEYNNNQGFAVRQINQNTSKVYNELKTNSCNVIPIIIVNKASL